MFLLKVKEWSFPFFRPNLSYGGTDSKAVFKKCQNMCSKAIGCRTRVIPLIDTHDQHLDQHSIDTSVDTTLTLYQHRRRQSVDSRLIFDQGMKYKVLWASGIWSRWESKHCIFERGAVNFTEKEGCHPYSKGRFWHSKAHKLATNNLVKCWLQDCIQSNSYTNQKGTSAANTYWPNRLYERPICWSEYTSTMRPFRTNGT